MIPALSRLFFILSLAVITAYISLHFLGSDWAIFTVVVFLSIPLIYSYINLATLKRYIQADSVENIPLPSGYWEEVYFGLKRLTKDLKQRMRTIEEQHSHFIEAFQASPNGIVMLDDGDHIEWCNSIAERFLGFISNVMHYRELTFSLGVLNLFNISLSEILRSHYFSNAWVPTEVLA